MEQQGHPLDLPELLNYTLNFVHDAEDLRACAMVNSCWVYPAQSRLFSSICIDVPDPSDSSSDVSRLLAILDTSPHLVGYISKLDIYLEFHHPEFLAHFTDLPWPRLTTLDLALHRQPHPQEVILFQRLISLPSLVSFGLGAESGFESQDDFQFIWRQCSPNLRHLTIDCHFDDCRSTGSPCEDFVCDRIRLDSLEIIRHNYPEKIQWWLDDVQFPFDLRGLKALRLCSSTHELEDVLAPAFDAIEMVSLQMTNMGAGTRIDLSVFGRLNQLEIELYGFDSELDLAILSTIRPENRGRIRAIRFCLQNVIVEDVQSVFSALDREISAFSCLKLVHFVVDIPTPMLIKDVGHFPLLNPRISLRWTFEQWWSRSLLITPWYSKYPQA